MEKRVRKQKKRPNNSVFSELFGRITKKYNRLQKVYCTTQMPARKPQLNTWFWYASLALYHTNACPQATTVTPSMSIIPLIVPHKCLPASHNSVTRKVMFSPIVPHKCLPASHNTNNAFSASRPIVPHKCLPASHNGVVTGKHGGIIVPHKCLPASHNESVCQVCEVSIVPHKCLPASHNNELSIYASPHHCTTQMPARKPQPHLL